MLEKRTFPRLDCPQDRPCTFSGRESINLQGKIINISRSGVSFISKNRLEDNNKLDIVIDYPELERKVSTVVKVIWSRSQDDIYSYGTRFVTISNEDKYDLLDHFYEGWKKDFLTKKAR